VNGICGCGLPARCCQPALAGGVIYADLSGEVSTHLALQALFTQCSPVCELLLQASPLPSTLGEVTLHPLSLACRFVYSSHGKWVFPPLVWSFPPTPTFTSFPALLGGPVLLLLPVGMFVTVHVGGGTSPLSCGVFLLLPLSQAFPLLVAGHVPLLPPEFYSKAWLVYLQFWEGFPSPPFWSSVCPTLFAMCLYFSYCLLLSFSFFPDWGFVCPRGYADLAQGCLWKYHILLSSPCP
jgi:hypothetical protein